MSELQGIIPPVVTPFDDDDEIDEQALRTEIRYHLDAGVHAISVAGSTGEGNALTLEEHETVYSVAVDEADDVPVVAGNISTGTPEAARKAALAADVGADYVMATPPHYMTPDDEGLIDFYREIGRAGGLPILIYDVIDHVDVTAELAAEMAEKIPELYGIKQSGGDFHGFVNMMSTVGDELAIVSALDDLLYPTFELGAAGAIAGINGIIPRLSVELWDAVQDGDAERASEIYWATLPLAQTAVWNYQQNFPGGVKTAMQILGREPGNSRSPIRVPTDERTEAIGAAIEYMEERGVTE
ncbi:dihydrodipicolinate synthase family protein [Halobium palmae]|uniref:Dihydrodipicolinate synthase family protein n=1 Tax=Halobium palmae TaxID=1776492 RepID=A0ABD5S2U6_9EURY